MIRVLLCLVVLVGTAQATDWSGYTSDTMQVAYQLGDVRAPDVPPPPAPDPNQAPLTDPVGPAPQRDEPSCAASVRRAAEPTCGQAVAPQCVAQQCVVQQQCYRAAPVRVQRVVVREEVACEQACVQEVQVRQRARLLGRGRLCARHHGGAVVGYAAPVYAAEPTCGG